MYETCILEKALERHPSDLTVDLRRSITMPPYDWPDLRLLHHQTVAYSQNLSCLQMSNLGLIGLTWWKIFCRTSANSTKSPRSHQIESNITSSSLFRILFFKTDLAVPHTGKKSLIPVREKYMHIWEEDENRLKAGRDSNKLRWRTIKTDQTRSDLIQS